MNHYDGCEFVDDFTENRYVVVPRVCWDRNVRWFVWDQWTPELGHRPYGYVRESSAQAVADRLNLIERGEAA